MDQRHDSSGRRVRLRRTSTGKRVIAQERDLLWFAKLAEHGPLPTSFLLEFSRHTHKSEKRAKERLTDLFHENNTRHGGPYLTRPAQQFRTIDSRYNQLVYDVAPAAWRALGQSADHGRPIGSGPWLHRFMVSCITASIELSCLVGKSVTYIPQSAILQRANSGLRYLIRIVGRDGRTSWTKDLIPDAIFGLEYATPLGRSYRFFALEADRATEPLSTANWHRKSFKRHLAQYEAYIEGGAYRRHLTLTAPMLVLNVTTCAARMQQMLRMSAASYPRGNNYQLFQTWEAFGEVFKPPTPNADFLSRAWSRPGMDGLRIGADAHA